jgi:two-component system invasion response regulator UvrY
MMIKVLIADDHQIVRQGLRRILDEAGDIEVVAEAENGREVLELARKHKVNVVVLDISMPGKSGLEVLSDLHAARLGVAVLVLTMHAEEHYAVRVLRAGAAGYLTKGSAGDELIDAIRKVAKGGRYLTSSVAEQLAIEFQMGGDKPLRESLSNREHDVMCFIAQGKSTTEIANELALSSKTISTYRARILQKLGLKNNAEIVRFAIDEGLVS